MDDNFSKDYQDIKIIEKEVMNKIKSKKESEVYDKNILKMDSEIKKQLEKYNAKITLLSSLYYTKYSNPHNLYVYIM